MATSPKVDYGTYMASREWRLKRKEALERAEGWCERCHNDKASQVHHLTYERLGQEDVDDLQALCKECHEYLSGERDDDPVYVAIVQAICTEGILVSGANLRVGYRWHTYPFPGGVCWHFYIKTSQTCDNNCGYDKCDQVIVGAPGIWFHGGF